MGPLIPRSDRLRRLSFLVTLTVGAIYAQTPPASGQCSVTAVPTQVRGEGLTERTGDILLSCFGSQPGAVLAGNLQVFLPVSITNRVDSNSLTTDATVSVDYGSGFVPTGVAGRISNQIIAFNGLSFTVPASGSLNLKVSNIRAAVYQLGVTVPQQITAQLSFSSTASILVNQSQLTVAYAQPGLFLTMYDRGNITCAGSPTPSTISLPALFAAKTAFASTRLTEGFAASFQPKKAGDDSGTRFLVKYSGFPAGAHIYLPDFVAGSDAVVPTSGGDLGVPQASGQYAAGSGALLLQRVQFANPDGSGGFPVSAPMGGTVTLDSASEVALTGGSGFAVYEVVDSNPNLLESAQFPTFVGLAELTAPAVAQESVTFAPVSTVFAASASAPVPRFAGRQASSDCGVLGDCSASYYPKLSVLANPVQLTAIAGGAMTSQPGYIGINNGGGGIMPWTAIVSYQTGSGWLILDYNSGQNNGSVRLWAKPQGLAAGTYTANVVIDAGGLAGTSTIPVTLVIAPAPTLPTGGTPAGGGTPVTGTSPTPPAASGVTVSKVVNAATFGVTPLVAGSLGTLMGSHLSGKNVAVTFDDLPATLLYKGESQINLQVPAGLGPKTSASLVVTVDGASSAPQIVTLAPAWPSLFANGVFNQDNSANAAGNGAKAGSVLQIFATGIPEGATVSVLIGARKDLVPLYAGAAPDVPGVQQVNVAVPEGVDAGSTQLAVCAYTAGQQYCSTGYALIVQ